MPHIDVFEGDGILPLLPPLFFYSEGMSQRSFLDLSLSFPLLSRRELPDFLLFSVRPSLGDHAGYYLGGPLFLTRFAN